MEESTLKGTINAETVLSGQIKLECNLIGKFSQGGGTIMQSADKVDILNLFNEENEL